MTSLVFEQVIQKRIPQNAISYCVDLFDQYPFEFKISRNRRSKSGDYRHDRRTNRSVVTVNSGLNQYSFLITLIHEIAHHTTRLKNKRQVRPHGPEWKSEFRLLMNPLINPIVFPEDLVGILTRHFKNPKASTWSDSRLAIALRKYNSLEPDESEVHLNEISDGKDFHFNKKRFTRIKKRRTRVLCLDCKSGRKYLIPGHAVVTMIEPENRL